MGEKGATINKDIEASDVNQDCLDTQGHIVILTLGSSLLKRLVMIAFATAVTLVT